MTEPEQWHGVYLGKVSQRRPSDPWVRVQIPQLHGTAETFWARPGGFGDAGTAPAVGQFVLVMFVGGDINRPAYFLTSQQTG